LVDCWLPYGDTEIYVSVRLEDYIGTLRSEKKPTAESIILENDIQTALDDPVGNISINELVTPDCKVTIAVDGTMNPALAVEGLKIITSRLVDLIVPRDRITIILGNGE
jgi:nickel-dependent lactate racemase